MTLQIAVAFAVAMFLWALLPGPGLAAVVSRALGSGTKAGFAVIAGLAVADVIFMGIAIVGLLAIATALGPMFRVVKYAGAAYLIWRGYRAIVEAGKPMAVETDADGLLWRDISLGLLITLGNPKAILFYGAILPAFVDMTQVGFVDFLILAGIVAGTSCLVYGGCIILAERTRRLMASTKAVKRLKQVTGTILIGSGIVVATR
jgi:threonine/homoserine/homoserine lactone efflux protein